MDASSADPVRTDRDPQDRDDLLSCRWAAFVEDTFWLALPPLIIGACISLSRFHAKMTCAEFAQALSIFMIFPALTSWMLGPVALVGASALVVGGELKVATWLVLPWAIRLGLMAWWTSGDRQSPGQKRWGLRVFRDSGDSPSFSQAIARQILAIGSGILLGAGYLSCLGDPRKRAWHDRLTKSTVRGIDYIPRWPDQKWRTTCWLILTLMPVTGLLISPNAHRLPRHHKIQEEFRLRGNVGTVSEGIAVFQEINGKPPRRVDGAPFLPKYLKEIPTLNLTAHGHGFSSFVEMRSISSSDGRIDPGRIGDTGHWVYDSRTGIFLADCTHRSEYKPDLKTWEYSLEYSRHPSATAYGKMR